jgi:hypothetical protein
VTSTLSTTHPPADTEAPGRGRRVGRRVVLGLITLLAGALTGGAVEALVVDRDGGIHRFHGIGHLVWLGLLVWVPYVLQWRRPERRIALWQGAAAAAAVLVVTMLSQGSALDDPVFLVAFPLLAALVALTHPARRRLLTTGGLSPVLAPLAALAAVPATLYAVDQLELQRTLGDDVHGELMHYASQAMVVLFVVVFAAVASLRAPGWQWVAGLAASAGVVLGVASLVAPSQSGAFSRSASAGVLALSLAFAAGALWEHRRG